MLDHLEDIIDNRPEQLSDIAGRMVYDAPSDTLRPVSSPAQRQAEWPVKGALAWGAKDCLEAARGAAAQAESWAERGDTKHAGDFARRAKLLIERGLQEVAA